MKGGGSVGFGEVAGLFPPGQDGDPVGVLALLEGVAGVIRRQKAQPLMWETRIFNSSTSSGSRPAAAAVSFTSADRAMRVL